MPSFLSDQPGLGSRKVIVSPFLYDRKTKSDPGWAFIGLIDGGTHGVRRRRGRHHAELPASCRGGGCSARTRRAPSSGWVRSRRLPNPARAAAIAPRVESARATSVSTSVAIRSPANASAKAAGARGHASARRRSEAAASACSLTARIAPRRRAAAPRTTARRERSVPSAAVTRPSSCACRRAWWSSPPQLALLKRRLGGNDGEVCEALGTREFLSIRKQCEPRSRRSSNRNGPTPISCPQLPGVPFAIKQTKLWARASSSDSTEQY